MKWDNATQPTPPRKPRSETRKNTIKEEWRGILGKRRANQGGMWKTDGGAARKMAGTSPTDKQPEKYGKKQEQRPEGIKGRGEKRRTEKQPRSSNSSEANGGIMETKRLELTGGRRKRGELL